MLIFSRDWRAMMRFKYLKFNEICRVSELSMKYHDWINVVLLPPRLWTPLHRRRHQQQVKHYSPYSALDHALKFTIYILFPISILHDLVNFSLFHIADFALPLPSAQHTNRVDKHLIYRVRSSTRLSEHQRKHIKARNGDMEKHTKINHEKLYIMRNE